MYICVCMYVCVCVCVCVYIYIYIYIYIYTQNPRYSLNHKLYVPRNHSGHFGEEKNLTPLPGINPVSSVVQPVA